MEDQKEEQKYFIMNFEDGKNVTSVSIPSEQVHVVAQLYYKLLLSTGLDVKIQDNFSPKEEAPDVEQSK